MFYPPTQLTLLSLFLLLHSLTITQSQSQSQSPLPNPIESPSVEDSTPVPSTDDPNPSPTQLPSSSPTDSPPLFSSPTPSSSLPITSTPSSQPSPSLASSLSPSLSPSPSSSPTPSSDNPNSPTPPSSSPIPPPDASQNQSPEPSTTPEFIQPANPFTNLSRAAIIGIAAGAGALVMLLLILILYCIVRRHRTHRNASYYPFTDSENPAPLPSSPPSCHNQLPPTADNAAGATATADDPSASAPAGVTTAGMNYAYADRDQAFYHSNLEGATAPSASQFSRRESNGSSDDTIVAPVYRQTMSGLYPNTAAPWFHAGGQLEQNAPA